MKKLLSKGSTNSKLAKNEKYGYKNSYILYLSPFKQNSEGINVCPKASPQCIAACLNTAGMGIFSNVQKARIDKTNHLLTNRKAFISQLWKELQLINKKAAKEATKAPVRLNGTSDLDFPKLFAAQGFDIFSLENIAFYDYTKVFSRLSKYSDKPYSLTFSRSEVNDIEVVQALKDGFNVAAVFRNALPDNYKGYRVINGDESDLRILDPKNVVVGLIAKGKGRKAETGFIID